MPRKLSPISRDRQIRFGRYCIRGTGTPIACVYDCWLAGDSIELLAEEFAIEVEQLRTAIEYWDGWHRQRKQGRGSRSRSE